MLSRLKSGKMASSRTRAALWLLGAFAWAPIGGCGLFEDPPDPPAAIAAPPAPRPARPLPPRQRPEDPTRAETGVPAPAQAAAAPTSAEAASRPGTEAIGAEASAVPARWRVIANRTIGCAAPDSLRLLRGNEGLSETQPRLAAQLLREGGCLTTFRVSEWTLVRADGEVMRLRLANPPAGVTPVELHFLRRDLEPATPGPPAG